MADRTIELYTPEGPIPVRLHDRGDGTYNVYVNAEDWATGTVYLGAGAANVGGVELPLVIVGAHVQNTSLSSVVEITVPAGAHQWLVQCQTKNVRFTLDSATAATAAVGFLLVADAAPVIIPVVPGQVIHVIEVAASAKLDYQFGA